MAAITVLYRHWALIRSFVKRDLLARYRGSTLGVLWTVVHPLVMLLLYTFVFSTVLKIRVGASDGTDSFAVYLFCGLLPWMAVSEGLNRSTGVILEHSNLIKRTIFPAEVLPVYPVLSGMVNELIGLAILFGALAWTMHRFTWLVCALPLILVCQFMLTVGLAWIIAGITVFVRDLGQMLGMLLTLWVFLTPIFYPPSSVPAELHWLLDLNPLHAVVNGYRSVILNGTVPGWQPTALLAGSSSAIFLVGYRVFRRMSPAFADVI